MTLYCYPTGNAQQPVIPAPSRGHLALKCAVVIPCHNYGRFLAEAVDSVLSQSHPAAEIVIVLDDCSDDSAAVARRYRDRGVQTIAVRCCDPLLSRRAGLRATSSPIVCFLDADDCLAEDYLETALAAFSAPGIGIVTGVAQHFGLTHETWAPEPCDLRRDNCVTSAALVRRAAIEGTRAFEQLEAVGMLSEDHWLWQRITSAGWSVAWCGARHLYRRHADNITLSYPTAWAEHYRRQAKVQPRQKVRVGFLTDCHVVGGVSRHFEMLVQHCRGVEWAGTVVMDRGATDDATVNRTLFSMPVMGGQPHGYLNADRVERRPTAAAALAELLGDADVIYTWGHGARATIEQAKLRVPVVAGLHATGKWAESSAAEISDLAAALVGVTERCRTCLPAAHRRRMVVVANGADLASLQPRAGRWPTRAAWGVPGKALAIGYVGRWSPEKNPMALARAVGALGPDAWAVYCSPHKPGCGVLEGDRREVERLTGGRVVWTQSATMGEVYAALDCLLLPSHEEGGPLVALEAFATGCPLVATPVGSLPTLQLQHGGLYVPIPQNAGAEAMAAAVRQAVDPIHAPAVSRAREFALYSGNAVRMARDWEGVFRSVARSQVRRSGRPVTV